MQILEYYKHVFHKNASLCFKGIILLQYLAIISLRNVQLQICVNLTNSNPFSKYSLQLVHHLLQILYTLKSFLFCCTFITFSSK